MYGCDCHIGCLSGTVTRIGADLSGNVTRLGTDSEHKELSGAVTRIGTDLSGNASLVCSTNKEKPYWVWNGGDILYWDNEEYIALDEYGNND